MSKEKPDIDNEMMEGDDETPSGSERLYRLVFEDAPIGLFLYDEKSVIRECNDYFVDIIGSSRKELIGLNMIDSLENEGVLKAIKESLEGGAGLYEGDYLSITGHKEFQIKLFCKPMTDDDGNLVGGVGIVDDLTDLIHAEQSFKESEEKYRLVVENASEAIIVAQDYEIKFVNPKVMAMTGYAESDLIDENFSKMIHPEDLAMVAERHKRRLEGEEIKHIYSFRIVRKDGETRWVEINTVQIAWDEKPATLNFLSDITERKRVEGMIASSEEKFRGLFESSMDGMAFCDMGGKVLDVNRSFVEMLGFTKDELVGRSLKEITPERFHEMEDGLEATKLLIQGDTGMYEKEYLAKEGGTVPVSVRSWLVKDGSGSPAGIWIVARDISEEMRVKGEIRRRMIEIEKLNKFMIGREVRIIEMKKEVNDLLRQHDQTPRYKV